MWQFAGAPLASRGDDDALIADVPFDVPESFRQFDLVGADRYSVGPFFGLSFLGVEWKAARGLYLTIDPTYVAIPVPNLVGIPFMYAQYRFLVGLEFGG